MTAQERDRLTKAEDRGKSNTHRIEKLEEQQEDLTTLIQSVATIAQKQVDMDTDLKEIKGDLKTISLRPAKRWESIVDKAVLAAVGVLMAYIAVKLGLM